MSQQEHVINGELLRLRREERGWVLSDMALRSCMSVKQIRQLEEGGTSAFYSEAVKLTAAKKAASVLGLSEQEVFAHEAQVSEVQQQVEQVEPTAEAVAPVQTTHETEPEPEPQTVEPEKNHVASPAVAPSTSEATRSSAVDAAKPKTSLWTIVGLFFFALAVAAYLQPQDEEATEAAPPLQAVPEAEAAASSAEPVASAASAAADTPASGVQKPVVAALPATPASTIAPARTSASASGAASAASSIQMPTPAASRAP